MELLDKTFAENKKDIRKEKPESIQLFLESIGEPLYRIKQIQSWIWEKSVSNFDSMTNISKKTREILAENYAFFEIKIFEEQKSKDRTIKSVFQLYDQALIEGVLIPTSDRMTACVSSQVGCSLSCKFCATGYLERVRNLDAAEIYDQVVEINRQAIKNYNIPLTNIVFMGMGEPLLNYANVMGAIDKITSPDGLNMSSKRITVSTAGISKMIKKLADDNVKFNLALSLHAANDEKRSEIMPINDTNTLEVLAESLVYFYEKTKTKITFEYIVFKDFNDTLIDAEELYQFAKIVPSKINIIQYNPIAQANYVNTDHDRLDQFSNYLENKGLSVTVRRSRGKDIDAACGQLAGKKI